MVFRIGKAKVGLTEADFAGCAGSKVLYFASGEDGRMLLLGT